MQSTMDSKAARNKEIFVKIVKISSIAGILILFGAAVIYLGINMGELLGSVTAAAVFAYLLLPLSKFMGRYMHQTLSALIAVIISFGSVIATVIFLTPVLIEQLSNASGNFYVISDFVNGIIHSVEEKINSFNIPINLNNIISESMTHLNGFISNLTAKIIDVTVGIFSKLPAISLVPILTFYFLKDKDIFKERFKFILPVKWRMPLAKIFHSSDKIIKSYIKTQLAVGLIIGVATMAAYYIIGVPYAFLLGIFMGICEIIPYFGPVIGAIPACVLILITNPDMLLWTILAVVAVQQLEGNFLSPYLMGTHFDINPVTVIAVLWIAGRLFGFAGFLFAIPIYAIFKDLFKVCFNKLVKAG